MTAPDFSSGLMMIPEISALLREGRELTSEDFRRISIVMRASLSTTIAAANDTYRAPSTHKLLITSLTGHLVFTALGTDDGTAITGLEPTGGSLRERRVLKAMNCYLSLVNNDTSEKLLGENHLESLASLMEGDFGGRPRMWDPPHILNMGQTLQLDVSLVDSATAAFIGGATEYGVVLDCILVRVKSS